MAVLTIFWKFLVVGVLEEWDYTGLTGQYWILQAAINTNISHHAEIIYTFIQFL